LKDLGQDQKAIYVKMSDQGKSDYTQAVSTAEHRKKNSLVSFQTSIKIYIAGLWPQTHAVLPYGCKQIILEMFFIATHLHLPREVVVQIVRWVIKLWPRNDFDMSYW